MLGKVYSASILGIEAKTVKVETDVRDSNLPGWSMVGLPETAVKEARERVASAIRNSGYRLLNRRITTNLSPADLKKVGAHFDLPIAISLLAASKICPIKSVENILFAGELSLSGKLLPIKGALVLALTALNHGLKAIVIPHGNFKEASFVKGIEIIGVANLVEAVHFLTEGTIPLQNTIDENFQTDQAAPDFSEVRGQLIAKRALEIASSGGHNVLMVGPPGTGKTMLAERLPSILSPLSESEAIEVMKIKSCHGVLLNREFIPTIRPFRAPHHSASAVGLSGGGNNNTSHIGEISLAHNGVLFLDELPEFRRDVLEVLRQPIERGIVHIVRAGLSISYPAKFMLVAAMNPCPCGYYGHPAKPCICSVSQIIHYNKKISGPLIDRIDLHITLQPPSHYELMNAGSAEVSSAIRGRVLATREIQQRRYKGKIDCNAELKAKDLEEVCALTPNDKQFLISASERMNISARSLHRILKISRTIADMSGEENINTSHISEAMQYRPSEERI
ncbi:MAG: YifB family Mg chelatase-like AAA ATPase [Pseudomonadota bacterium]